ncbi:hypothetical protein [Calothrix sp. PCC 7507]|uniref:hypothetical protein n=1 Tax=Calothrix sp. PCC 7507 TaxID=99598 RepID=UPI00029F1948|nr:hypothetical protein [Calothrix sp. PCC 7507]AFY31033.1 hypothetical protein Cal7507_0541 [Calothrix sp. PCC 7507]
MSEKNLEPLIVKIVKKVIKKEISKLKQHNLPTVSNQTNHSLDNFVENVAHWENQPSTEEIIDNIYASGYVSLPSKENIELEHQLRELKFKQELRKDWILFIIKDVVVYSATIIFIFAVASFYLFTLIQKY